MRNGIYHDWQHFSTGDGAVAEVRQARQTAICNVTFLISCNIQKTSNICVDIRNVPVKGYLLLVSGTDLGVVRPNPRN